MSSGLGFTRALVAAGAVAFLAACGTTIAHVASKSSAGPADVSAAKQAALTLFVQAGTNWWMPCPSTNEYADCPLSPAVRDRLASLVRSNYFYSGPGGHCAGDFISNSTNGLQQAPKVVSAVADPGGNVTVVIERSNTQIPDLTAVMSKVGDRWLATDLASGSGPNASIFAANPNC